MLKHLNSLLCLKWVLHYGKIEWYCGTKSFTYGYFAVLKKILLVLLWYDSGVYIGRLNLGGMLNLSFALSLPIYASFQLLDLQMLCLSHLLVFTHPRWQMILYKNFCNGWCRFIFSSFCFQLKNSQHIQLIV